MDAPETLPLTGERTVPGIAVENYWFRRHEAAYEYALTFAQGRTVLEVGCGEGYGTALLARSAASVTGLDYDAITVAHAARTYPGASFVRGNLAALPVTDASVGLLVTLQVVEHVWDHVQFVRECLRVLRPGGVMLMSTPNRLTFSPGLDEPVNPFHTKEFTAAELADLVTTGGFEVEGVLGLHAGPRLTGWDAAHGGSFVTAQIATPPQDWPRTLHADVASVTTGDFEIRPDEAGDVDASLDLVLLARRPQV